MEGNERLKKEKREKELRSELGRIIDVLKKDKEIKLIPNSV